jgi:structure-specific recognition protein 1
MSEVTLSNIFWGHSDGVLALSSSGILWRSRTTEAQKKLNKDEIVTILWTPMGEKNHHVKVYQKGGKYVRFTGLKAKDIDLLKQHVENIFDRELEKEKVTSIGGNWGEMKFEGTNLNFRDKDDASILEIPLNLVSQCALPGKNEVELQFHEDDTVAGDEETLVEMRLYLPSSSNVTSTTNENDDQEENSRVFQTAESFRDEVLQRANIRNVTGKSIVELDETIGTFLTPRGRYGVEIYANFLRMHGKTFDYKIMYSNINRCFLLELPNGINTAFVISLEEPIRQGKQGYPHLVLQLSKEDVHIDVHLSTEEIKKYNGNIHERMSGTLPQIVATLFKFIIGKKVYTSGKFKTHSGDRGIKCAVKAQSGVLFPLEKSFMFIHKPTTFIRYEEIEYIEFQRYAGQTGSSASRNFDLLVSCKSVGGEPAREVVFSAIDRREFPELSQFLTSKKLRVRNLKEDATSTSSGGKKRGYDEYLNQLGPEEGEIEDEEEEDSDFKGSEDDDGSDDFSDESLSGQESESESDKEDGNNKKKMKETNKKQKKSKKNKKKEEDEEE